MGRSIFTWPFDPTNDALVAGWGFWLGIAGLVGTIVGFILTLIQVWRVQKAAEAAKLASDRARMRVARYDVASEISRASSALATTRENIKRDDWPAVVESYADARVSLARISELPSEGIEDSKKDLQEISDGIEKAARKIALIVAKGESVIDRMKLLHAHADHEIAIVRIAARIDRTK